MILKLNAAKTEILRIGDEHIEKKYIIVDADRTDITNNSIEAICLANSIPPPMVQVWVGSSMTLLFNT